MCTFQLKKLRSSLLLAFLFCLSFSANSYALDAGSKAPDFELPGVQGTVKLSSTAGSVVYVDFWASWCGPCKQSFLWMNAMQDKYRAQGLQVIGVNLDAKSDDAKKFLSQTLAHFTVAFDSKGGTPKNYGVKGMPTSFLVGRDGKIIFQHLGFKEADREKLEQEIKAALEAKK
ncbi:MAG: TlpA family protein disulfide reductase [Chlorobium sp.]|nr:MAG: TlpA family protein disulfide reductase [Chlorobium sp.]